MRTLSGRQRGPQPGHIRGTSHGRGPGASTWVIVFSGARIDNRVSRSAPRGWRRADPVRPTALIRYWPEVGVGPGGEGHDHGRSAGVSCAFAGYGEGWPGTGTAGSRAGRGHGTGRRVWLAAAPAASAATSHCLIINNAINTSYTSLQAAVTAAASGATLWVRGTCTGTATISTSVTITGQQPAGFTPPTLSGGGPGPVLGIEINPLTVPGVTLKQPHRRRRQRPLRVRGRRHLRHRTPDA